MTNKLDIRQSETRVLQDQLNLNTVEGMDSTLSSVNNELTPSCRLMAQPTPSLAISVGAGTVVNPNTSINRVLPFISGNIVNFTNGTITFPSTSGTITVTPGTNSSIVIGPNQFVGCMIQLNGSGNLAVFVGTAVGSLAAVAVPGGNGNSLSIGYVIVQSDGSGNIQNITNANLYQFSEGNSIGGGIGGKTYPSVFLSPAGSGDVTTLGAAIAALPAAGGVILLTDPINLAGVTATIPHNVLLLGRDQNASITFTDTTSLTVSGNDVGFKDLLLIDQSSATNYSLVNVTGSGFTLDHCKVVMQPTFAGHIGIDINSGVFGAFLINNLFTGVIAPSVATAVRIQAGSAEITLDNSNRYTP